MAASCDIFKAAACNAIDKYTNDLEQVSEAIWQNPELKFEEHFAHQILTDFLEKHNFKTEKKFVLETGFRSIYGDAKNAASTNIALISEYDALPGIGHACGHNLIAEVGVAAAVGIKAAIDAAKDAGKDLGMLTVLGTPGEEGGGGKLDLIDAGAFDSVDVALMAHPWPYSDAKPTGFIARELCSVTYHGKASHAAAFPWEGVNALDAAVMAYSNISVMRQQMKPSWRVHGVITNGGAKPNIIPEEAALEYYLRAPTVGELNVLKEKCVACLKGAATATGCQVDIEWGKKPYLNLINNDILASKYEENATHIGLEPTTSAEKTSLASTDMGNVSHKVPSLHPCFYIGGDAFNHTRPFTALAGDPKAQLYTLNVAKALAMTAIDVYMQPSLVDDMKTQLENDPRRH